MANEHQRHYITFNTIHQWKRFDASNGEIYVSDAIDYLQRGSIYRYSASGNLIDQFKAGIIPGGFCFR